MAIKILNTNKNGSNRNIVVFNNKMVIASGKFILAEKYLQDPSATISVKNMIFDKNRHTYSEHPWIPYLFNWNLTRIINIAKKILRRR